MNTDERIELSKLLKEYNPEETTEQIRKLRHSSMIRNEVQSLEKLKQQYSRIRKTNPDQFRSICEKRCDFLYNNYTNIFNRIFKDELDLTILSKFLSVLKQIEDGSIDQHEGSYMIGNLLKELYIDSALRGDKSKNSSGNTFIKPKTNISWSQYKEMKNDMNQVE